ncbi:MAG TPA: dihydrofolate reductase family protein [Catalimonadaceae bacterium]|nr:dihydrofolate reductase family protein [Catalimonadaceae bacterium]HPI11036.1 dihydrofolate reductase family protein [Catalimonadaceae bacterium]
MRKIQVFNFITLDGYYKDQDQGIGWHQHGKEEGEFSAENMKSGNCLLFGRKTFEMMKEFWTSPIAADMFPEVAKGMNAAEKWVCSRTIPEPGWTNSQVITGELISEIRKMKQSEGADITILGSGEIVTQLTEANLVDAFQIMIDPVVIGSGTSVFSGITNRQNLRLVGTRTFSSGAVLLDYLADSL